MEKHAKHKLGMIVLAWWEEMKVGGGLGFFVWFCVVVSLQDDSL